MSFERNPNSKILKLPLTRHCTNIKICLNQNTKL
ncbi:hypothetical protein KC19_11G106600 [Ceratodon purpureus]|uniref:Uncharacterized protein n=1 Tax=Ceratodon purpureus TaxID=3225 RepID=A0A8T0GD55_CERPU|nr:hypothetical protein KC19_11G106600 [Ceratodon purpureus]